MVIKQVIPAHNEAKIIGKTLQSLVDQTLRPARIVVVDDNSTDATSQVVTTFSGKYDFIELIQNESSTAHAPGSKVINAFYQGYNDINSQENVNFFKLRR